MKITSMADAMASMIPFLLIFSIESYGFAGSEGPKVPKQLSLYAAMDRRQALAGISILIGTTSAPMLPLPSQAGEIGARITEAVTTSDIGISVRTSVVRGAQTMDQIDRQWEAFSDRFKLGSERSKQQERPEKKDIPPLKPLDSTTAASMLKACDGVFSEVTGLSPVLINQEVNKVNQLVRPAFERSGSSLSDPSTLEKGEQFNYLSYVHFKAYSNILVDKKIDFPTFLDAFQKQLGLKLLVLFDLTPPSQVTLDKAKALASTLAAVKTLVTALRDKGFLAASEVSSPAPDQVEDWVDDVSDLQLSVALDGDVTMNAQILLQEQGFNLIPSFSKFMIRPLMQLQGQRLSIEEYYMDTDYNSNPDLFEVKEVLLNIVLESA